MQIDSHTTSEKGAGDIDAGFRQFLASRSMLRAYIFAIVREPHAVEDALSDTAIEIVKSWRTFDSSRPFGPWARTIARRIAIRKASERLESPILLNESALASVADAITEMGSETELERRKEVLRGCIKRLSPSHQDLVRMRYFGELGYEEIAARTRKTVGALYTMFSRIHQLLGDCVEKQQKAIP